MTRTIGYLLSWLLFLCSNIGVDSSLGSGGQAAASIRSNIESFKVMDILARATELEEEGRHICHMEVGQPSTKAPRLVLESAQEHLKSNMIGYTNALGITPLKKVISELYERKYGKKVPPDRVVVTTGSSAAFLFAFIGCFDPLDHVALASAGYPCYRNIMKATGLLFVSIPVNREYKVTARELQLEVDRRKSDGLPPLKGLILSSPSNPTGSMLTPNELRELCECCERNGIRFLSDEIYHGISYGTVEREASAVEFSRTAVVINSFSKYYSMTGWRLGWMVVPSELVDAMNRLSQNMYINAPTLSQLAACEAFGCSTELDGHVERYARNRRTVLETLKELGFSTAKDGFNDGVPKAGEGAVAPADGAFYVYVDLSSAGVTDTPRLCLRLLEEAGVAITPGTDFEDPSSGLGPKRIRFSYSRSESEVTEGMKRFKTWWLSNML